MKLLFLFFGFVVPISGMSQKFTISGYVRDAASKESLIGATVVRTGTASGTTTNAHGFYSITLSTDTLTLSVGYVGYQTLKKSFVLNRDTVIYFELQNTVLNEVVVSDSSDSEYLPISTISVPMEKVKTLPVMLGETDILKTIQLMPGVQSGNEGTTGLYVRGGGPDQNLMLLDGVPIYNASHLFGFFSIFNTDAIKRVDLIKGGFPARYGGRLSSVVDIHMKEGNMSKIKGEASIGLVASKMTIEGPIIKDKTSFIVSARRTYVDLLAQPFLKKKYNGALGYHFADLNVKLNHIFNTNNRVFYSVYAGTDKAKANTESIFNNDDSQGNSNQKFSLMWGNVIHAIRWNHIYGSKLFGNVTATYSRYLFNVNQSLQETTVTGGETESSFYSNKYSSAIRDWAIKSDFDYFLNPDHVIRFGASAIAHKFTPGVIAYSSSSQGDTTSGIRSINAYETSLYAEDEWNLRSFKLNYGLHYSTFSVNRVYQSLQPRITVDYIVSPTVSIRGSFATMTQFIHLLTNAGVSLPTDLWVPSTPEIRPQGASQLAIGATKRISIGYEISLEGYYKKMNHLIDYKDGATYILTTGDWQDKVVKNGKGESKGIELFIQKTTGRITGWLGYTLSKTTRTFAELNEGKAYPYKYDRRHDISLTGNYNFSPSKYISIVWVFGTGNAITLPIAQQQRATNFLDTRYPFQPGATYYGGRNSYRMRSYHRLDVSYSWSKKKKWGESKWSVGLYNAYNRLNPFYIELGRDSNQRLRYVQYTLFPVIPSITYTAKF